MSVEYLAVVLMGTTGWSGYDDEQSGYWRCRRADLTPDGLALVESLERLYEGKGLVHLQTWLDT